MKQTAAVLVFGAVLGAAASVLSGASSEPLHIEVVEKYVEIEPAIGGQETDIELPPPITFTFPIASEDWKITSEFGVRISPRYKVLRHHEGVDISVDDPRAGMPQIVAIADGTIRDHWLSHETRGKYIVIDHGNGLVSSYSHLSESFIHERRYVDGELVPWTVKAGEPIGRMGATGLAYGAHLHFQLEIEGDTVNPMLYMNEVLPEWEHE
jgi:murein DD-endopeptidase MepM/ murein hydrolase activator NlpD